MKDLGLDVDISTSHVWTDSFSTSKNIEAQEIVDQWSIVKEKLKKIYFFTEQQLNEVFDTNAERDILFFDQIIADVEQKYTSDHISFEIPINEYLYETLTHIEDKSWDAVDESMYRDALTNIDKYIGKNAQMIQYDSFQKSRESWDMAIRENIINYIQNSVKDFFLIHIDQDINVSDEEKDTLPGTIKNLLKYSEFRWINFYVFVQKDGKIAFVPWVFGWSTWRANDSYFGDIFKQLAAKKVDIALSSLVSSI